MSALAAARRSLKPQATTTTAPIATATRPISNSSQQQMSSESLLSLSSPPPPPPLSSSFRPQEQHRPHHHHQSFTQHHRQYHHNNNNNHNNNHNQQHHQHHNMAHYKYHNDCHASVLTYEQVRRLDYVMSQTVPIHGRGNFPTLYVKLKELIRLLKHKLQTEHSIDIGDVRLNGGGASFVLAPENSHYNDLDLILCTDLSNQDQFDVIRDVVLECLREFLPGGSQAPAEQQATCHNHQMPQPPQNPQQQLKTTNSVTTAPHLSNCALKEAYVHKMVKVNDDDRWSLISLGVQQSEQQVVTAGTGNSCQQAGIATSAPHQLQSVEQGSDEVASEQHQHQPVLVPQHQTNTNNHQAQQSYQHQDQPTVAQATHHQYHAATIPHNHHHHQPHLYYHNQNITHNHRQNKQFPNSIELKFVDRMRRKFEFSVDSFQIILDSLIQFYDYAPQSIALNGEKSTTSYVHSVLPDAHIDADNQQASSETSDIEPTSSVVSFPFNASETAIDHQVTAAAAAATTTTTTTEALPDTVDAVSIADTTANSGSEAHNDETGLTNNQHQNDNHHQTQQRLSKSQIEGSYSMTKSCTRAHEDGYYHQIPVDSSNSPSVSSIASSSGCSSSSSVVSSLSCDDDHEELYCDPDSLPPSPASSSSLLGSTTSSLILTSDIVSNILSGSTKLSQLSQEKCENKIELKKGLAYDLSDRIESLSKDDCSPSSAKYQNNGSICNKIMPWQEECSLSTCSSNSANNETSCPVISENFYPTVICRSEYGNFKEALYHLEKKLIATRSPEEIRGGGLLKYCNLLVKNYKPTNVYQIRTLERYMCSRFFIDFSELSQQQAKLESYLANHFSDDPALKFDYLTILHNVVQRSTVCLMNHELRLTLNMIREFAYKQNEMQQHQAAVAASTTQISNLDPEHLSPSHQNHLTNKQAVAQTQQQQHLQPAHYYQSQKPVLIQSGVYRVKLVNYTLLKPVKP